MSPLLALAVVLLVIVGGLAWWQRRATRDLSPFASRVVPPETRGGAVAARTAATAPTARLDDAVIGGLTYHGGDAWTGEESLALGGHDVVLQILAGPDGPTDEHRAWVKTAIDRFPIIDADARALLSHVLEPLGVAAADLEPWQLMVGPHDGGVFEGRLYYDVVHETVDELYVRSVEQWTVLEPYFNAERSSDDLPERPDRLLGSIGYNGESCWSNRTPFVLAGRQVQALYLAGPSGPSPEHHEWLEAAIAGGEGLARRAGALAATHRGWDADAVTVAIVTVGADETGRFIGGLTCHGSGGGPCYLFSRDKFATLSLERN